MNRRNMPDEVRYRLIEGIRHKICMECKEYFQMDNDHFYNNKSNKKDGLNTYCIPCVFERAKKWVDGNPDKYKEQKLRKVAVKTDIQRQRSRDASRRNREEGYTKRYQQENKDKIYQYNKKRRQHKSHEITDQEWFDCLDFFNNTCAYCGITEQEQFLLYDESFHKEHVDHNGSNYVENCVPSCTSCNATKNTKGFNEWYNVNNPKYKVERYNKIIKWMTSESFRTLNLV